jgi:D-arabinose 5-phosphate isomerase GutQ
LKFTKDILSLRSNSNATNSIVNLDEKAKDIRIHC